ncbi:MAG: sulfatase [Verrucomicrobiales bacterium]|nr:sulfatase [Verrucomicrobiales bacterium]
MSRSPLRRAWDWSWVLSFIAVLLAGLGAMASSPNIVFILADDLGYTDLACYGSRYYETPALDRMAAEGMRFTSGYTSGPNCQPTRAALITGQYGPRTGIYTVGHIDRFNWRRRPLRPVDNVEQLPLEKLTIAQALQRAGYRTGLFGKWHLGQDPAHHPAQRGFDEAMVSMGRHFDFTTVPPANPPADAYLADWLTERALDFIGRHRRQPFFLCLHHFAVHSPYQAKPEQVARFRDRAPAPGHADPVYAAMVASVDESVGRVLAALDEGQLSRHTLVIFTSDNGGVGGYQREGLEGGNGITDNAPLRSGKGSLYEGGIRVPYLFRWPGTIAAGARCDEPITSVDLYPTLLEVAGASPPADHPLDGHSYLDLLLGQPKATPRPPLFWHFPGYLGQGQHTWRTTPVSVIRDGDWKLLHFLEDDHLELYDLQVDLGERANLATKEPARTQELLDGLQSWRMSIQAPMPTPHVP